MIIPSPSIREYFHDDNGKPLAGGLIYTYKAGTTEPYATYTDSTGMYENTNPIVLDSAGSASIFVKASNEDTGEKADAYRYMIYSKDGELIHTVDNVMSIKGEQGIAGGEKGDRGEQGEKGDKGVQGRRGFTGPVGSRGEKGDNGTESIIWRTPGTYSFTVPEGVSSIDYQLCGGGGGFQTQSIPPLAVTSVVSGIAGQVVNGTISVGGGDVITIVVGIGGGLANNEPGANGGNTTISGLTITTVTANGGNGGGTGISSTLSYYQKANPFQSFIATEGYPINIIPQPISGESSQFGDGGNILKYGTPNATGNGSSGGSGEFYLGGTNNNQLYVSSLGTGAPGLVEFTFFKQG